MPRRRKPATPSPPPVEEDSVMDTSTIQEDSSVQEPSETPPRTAETPTNAPSPPDADTLRILLSTDNHLGYAETDPVRGNDSFCALEEVLVLAKHFCCDMVLLSGDLFHENNPSRSTLHKTMQILKRYCCGDNAVRVQYSAANVHDPHTAIDLPIFSIHGNHDDPVRNGADVPLAALGK